VVKYVKHRRSKRQKEKQMSSLKIWLFDSGGGRGVIVRQSFKKRPRDI